LNFILPSKFISFIFNLKIITCRHYKYLIFSSKTQADILTLFVFGTTDPSGPWSPHSRGF